MLLKTTNRWMWTIYPFRERGNGMKCSNPRLCEENCLLVSSLSNKNMNHSWTKPSYKKGIGNHHSPKLLLWVDFDYSFLNFYYEPFFLAWRSQFYYYHYYRQWFLNSCSTIFSFSLVYILTSQILSWLLFIYFIIFGVI